jgi:hypothetical protein
MRTGHRFDKATDALAFAGSAKAAEDVGFYYAANAGDRG